MAESLKHIHFALQIGKLSIVKKSLMPYTLVENNGESGFLAKEIIQVLSKGDTTSLFQKPYAIFASIAYINTNISKYEVFTLLGQYINYEQHTALVRCDDVIETKDYVYLFKSKVDKSTDQSL